jgi:hypothetical protein
VSDLAKKLADKLAALGPLQIDCACGQTLSVPVAVTAPETYDGSLNSITATLRIDHAFIAAHIATHA